MKVRNWLNSGPKFDLNHTNDNAATPHPCGYGFTGKDWTGLDPTQAAAVAGAPYSTGEG